MQKTNAIEWDEQAADAWAFILRLYDADGVKKTCLHLQDSFGVDVSLLLFLLWLERDGRIILDQQAMEKLDEAVRPWRDNVVKVLRGLRRDLAMMDSPGAYNISRLILNSEIAAEKEMIVPLLAASAKYAVSAPLSAGQNARLYLAMKNAKDADADLAHIVGKSA